MVRQYIMVALVLLSCSVCLAQSKADKDFEKIRTLLIRQENDKAEKQLLKMVEKYPEYLPAHLALGEVYFVSGKYALAKPYLLFVVSNDPAFDPNCHIKLADIYEKEGKTDSCEAALKNYLNFSPDREPYLKKRKEVLHRIDCLSFRQEAIANPVNFAPYNLGAEINSQFDEYLPTITADESSLLFTRREKDPSTNKYEEGFYLSEAKNGQWQKAELLPGVLNSQFNEGAACISPDGRYIYFTRCHAPEGAGSCDIYRSEKKGNTWGKAENLGTNVNSAYWDAQPTIASDGRTLFFASNRPGGMGESDIYFTYLKDDGSWTKAKNCGEIINTEGKEISPFIHPSNQVLYFASNYHCGMGGLDIFYSNIENGKFLPPQNMGYPINTASDESSLIVSARGNYAIYASQRDEGKGGLDLYAFELDESLRPPAVTYVCGKITDIESGKAVRAKIEVRNLENTKVICSAISDDKSGEYLVCLPVGADYAFSAASEGYLFHSENFSLKNSDGNTPYQKDIAMKQITVGSSLVLNNIFYSTASSSLLKESFAELNTLVKLLNENPSLKVEIEGHTDNVGSEQYNNNLSQKRADAVKNYLVEKGIAESRLKSRGYGFTKPIADNSTEEGRAKNRRTQIRITER